MESIKIQVPVTVKAKLTEKFRTNVIADLKRDIEELELEIRQLNIQQERALQEQAGNPQVEGNIRRHFGNELQKRQQFRAEAIARQEHIEKLAIGAEIVQGTLQRVVELKVGDDMRDIMSMEVLVEDDKVIAIRN